jgi:hypothetical protein
MHQRERAQTAVSLQPAGSGNQETNSKGFIGLEAVLESVSKGKIHEPKDTRVLAPLGREKENR